MDRRQYCKAVEAILDAHVHTIGKRLKAAFDRLPARATGVVVGVHVDQDGEGFLSLRVHLDGPDLHVLNKALGDTALLFDTVMTECGFDPPLPLMPARNAAFSVPDVLCDCALRWIASNWKRFGLPRIGIPVSAASMGEDDGDLGAILLSPADGA